MGRPAGWMTELTGRAPMKSPGKPSLRREVERCSGSEIAKGLSSEEAAVAVGVSQAVGSRWFRERGGMPTFMLVPLSGRYLSFEEREEIALLQGAGCRCSGDRPAARALAVDGLAGAAPQRGHARREARVPRVGRAVEGGAGRAPTEDREARRERPAARVRAGAAVRVRFAGRTGHRGAGPATGRGRAGTSRIAGSPLGRARGARSRSLTG